MRGTFIDKLVCPTCGEIRHTEQPFTNISIDVKNISELSKSMAQYGAKEVIDDYRCDQCGEKVSVEKSQHLHTLPPYFILHQKRFDFDYQTFRNTKLSTPFAFPINADLYVFDNEQELCE